jgi:hypothetical protein
MKKRMVLFFILLTFLSFIATAVHATTVLTGNTDGGAYYRIVVPADWNGDLVIWNHGFTLNPPQPLTDSDLGPLLQLQLSEGYAVAASSYRESGWAVFKTNQDLQGLVGAFKDNFGRANKIFLTGASLGGIVTADAIENAHLGNVVGAFTFCGAMAGSRNWDGALDLRLVYDTVCSSVPAANIPGGAYGLPEGSTLTPSQMASAVNACTGILSGPYQTPDQLARLSKILSVSQLPANMLLTDMSYCTFAMSNLYNDPQKLNGHLGTGNANVDYGDAFINQTIARVSPNPGANNKLERNYTPTGAVGNTKIVSLHTDKDGLVIVENQNEYAKVVPSQNLTTAIAVESTPSHCGFTNNELIAGWESLRQWVSGYQQPTAAAIQALCVSLGGPCRIDPNFVIPDMDARVRPRQP